MERGGVGTERREGRGRGRRGRKGGRREGGRRKEEDREGELDRRREGRGTREWGGILHLYKYRTRTGIQYHPYHVSTCILLHP